MDIEAQRRIARTRQQELVDRGAVGRQAGDATARRRDRLADWCGQRLIGLGWRLARPGLHLGAPPAFASVPAVRTDGC